MTNLLRHLCRTLAPTQPQVRVATPCNYIITIPSDKIWSRKPTGGRAPAYSGRTGSMPSLALLACVELWPAQTPRTGWMRSVHTATHTPLHWTEGLSTNTLLTLFMCTSYHLECWTNSCCLTPTEEPPQNSSCHRDCCLSLVHRNPPLGDSSAVSPTSGG